MDYGLSNIFYGIIFLSIAVCEGVENCVPVVKEQAVWVPTNEMVEVSCEVGKCNYRFEDVTWRRHGQKINDYTESISVIHFQQKAKLRIRRMNESYEGEYVCQTEFYNNTRSIYIHIKNPLDTTECETEPTLPSSTTEMTSMITSFNNVSTQSEGLTTVSLVPTPESSHTTPESSHTTPESSHTTPESSHATPHFAKNLWTTVNRLCVVLAMFYITTAYFP